ncbi:helix-turn-helix domain-containing protein [Limosilactobacillus reuteri]|uniref:helix-turn-helix domain-containing protein n=1 Tax=Limosilactobacillus reuteri TaxID=1598 RepID=UPI001E57328A|nr:helix-turn-helix transcriptional regulator [Limosilactobacillus reuteri]MCC4501062.1 helix-turn-helix transcriptional regulator [Limosilactobacillus reuteri]MCC4505283.1 helix-turn-helix transcriptional regulator [Limosilactobacillus reuteri]MCC4506445.1 helix-turn-helix transcriptional regulator [Limosilactobacillus reuteri]
MTDTLKSMRVKQGLTQKEVAEKLHVTVPTVSSWERGISSPYPRYIPVLADVLNTTRDNIFLLTNNKKLSKIKKNIS